MTRRGIQARFTHHGNDAVGGNGGGADVFETASGDLFGLILAAVPPAAPPVA